MSLLLILGKLWRYRLATVPIVVLIVAGALYVVAFMPSTYEANSSYIFLDPPAPPTADDIARNPALGKINADNPYTRYGNDSVVVQLLAAKISSDQVRGALTAQGAGEYTAEQSVELGFSAPILAITGRGTTPAAAIKTNNLVASALARTLDQIQASRGIDNKYRIQTDPVAVARDATLKASGKLRVLVGVLALGAILLFMAVSILDAVSALKAKAKESRTDDGDASSADLVPLMDDGTEDRFAARSRVEPLRRQDPSAAHQPDVHQPPSQGHGP